MRYRDRIRDDQPGGGGGNTPGGAGNLENLRAAGREALRAGDEAANNALSHGQSEAFLAATQQEGGQ